MNLAQSRTAGSHTQAILVFTACLSMAFGWWWPGTVLCSLMGWLSALFLCRATLRRSGYLSFWAAGALLQIIGFYWLFHTISYFGGFGLLPTSGIFGLYVLVSALQFPLFLFAQRRLPVFLDAAGLRCAIAWCVVEYLPLRIFPWYAGHTQLGFAPLAQTADIAGTIGISFVMLWVSESVVRIVFLKQRNGAAFVSFAVFLAALIYGGIQLRHYSAPGGAEVNVAVVQANISVAEKHDQKFFETNINRYLDLSRKIAAPDTLIIWPESVITDPVPLGIGRSELIPLLAPLGRLNAPMLVGALTADYSTRQYHNSAVAIYADGSVPHPYHKRILMPFGEYMPFAAVFPWLKQIFDTPDFEPGTSANLFDFRLRSQSGGKDFILRAASNVCYEDVVSSLSRDAVREGAEVLVNHTNDAWYGDTVAPYQHHLIASFRAIENRRYFIRSTNTGYTAIIDPAGKTTANLPVFSEGTIKSSVVQIKEMSVYTAWIGDYPWLILLLFSFIWITMRRIIVREIQL